MSLISLLRQEEKITQAQALDLSTYIDSKKCNEIDAVFHYNYIDSAELAELISQKVGLPVLSLERIQIQSLPPTLVDTIFLKKLMIIPLARRNDKLVLATSNPLDDNVFDKIKQRLKLTLDIVVVDHAKLKEVLAIEEGADLKSLPDEDEINALASKQLAKMSLKINYEDHTKNMGAASAIKRSQEDIDDSPTVRFLQKIFIEALKMGASDLHFEPFEKDYRIRFRVDGVLHEVSQPPIDIKDKLSTRIKVLSRLDISEKRIPQDGRMKIDLGSIDSGLAEHSKNIDVRVSTLPTIFGEKVVMRVLESHTNKLDINVLGYEDTQKKIIMNAINRPHGMVLVTGPTGSGKTVSLYTFLKILNTGNVNISSAEDPVEIQVHGINQVSINEKAGLNFASALRSFLRQDPDIIMVGEIRDLETADIAVKAAQTGHLVFSTLHTNDAPSTLMRLANMGVASFNIASSIHLITAQRLPRRLCVTCKAAVDFADNVLEEAGFSAEQIAQRAWQAYKPVGCVECNYTGYKGRVGVYQIMPITEDMQRIILNHGSVLDISQQCAKEGVLSLRQSALLKVMQGLTSLDEVLIVTNQ
jgi:type IV pilus assembly protein PilB